jgi:CCR4-NOT transcription complex subunit 1
MVLTANQSALSKMPDPLQPGLKIDRLEEIRESPMITYDIEAPLQQAGLLDLIDQALQSGPSEDAVAHIAHAVQRKTGHQTTAGFVPVNVDTLLIDAIVVYVGMHSIAKASQKGGPTFIQASPDAALLTMLIHELSPEARYYFLNSMVNQLRFPNSHTHYFSQALLEVFGNDMNDQEESEIRQQITRILFERLIGHWPQPWGLIITIVELIKNEKYMFFELPFIKSVPEVRLSFQMFSSPLI